MIKNIKAAVWWLVDIFLRPTLKLASYKISPGSKPVYNDPRFKQYYNANKFTFNLFEILTALSFFLAMLSIIIQLPLDYIYVKSATYPTAFYFPSLLFRLTCFITFLITSIIFWNVYHRYVAIFHSNVVNPLSKVFALLAICASFLSAILTLITHNFIFIVLSATAYGCAFIFCVFHSRALHFERQELKKKHSTYSDAIPLIDETLLGWLLVNFVSALSLLIMHLILSKNGLGEELFLTSINDAHIRTGFYLLYATIVSFTFINLLIGGMRSSVTSRYDEYINQVHHFNECYSNIISDPSTPSGGTTGGSREISGSTTIIKTCIGIFDGLLRSTRFLPSALASIIIYFSSNSFEYSCNALFFLMFSYVFNDAMDFEKDKITHPNRPLPMGIINLKTALLSSGGLFIIGLSTAYIYGEHFRLFLIVYLLSAIYSLGLKFALPSIATILWSLIITTLILYPIDKGISEYCILFFFIYARELLLDYRDIKADDLHCLTRSLPSLIGNKIGWIVISFLIVSLAFSIVSLHYLIGLGILVIMIPLILSHIFSIFPSICPHFLSTDKVLKYSPLLMQLLFPLIILL